MSKCQFCKDEVEQFGTPRKAHLVAHMDESKHIHIHGDLDKKGHVQEMLEAIQDEVGIAPKSNDLSIKEIVFHNRQRIGDILMFTCAVRDFKAAYPDVRVNVVSTAGHIWDHNPNIDRSLKATPENTLKIGPSWLTNASNRLDWHFANAYRISMEQALKVNIPQGESRPDIWLTEEEYNAPRTFEQPYWIICITGEKGWGCKMYPVEKWQCVVESLPNITFVQIGAKEDNPPRLKGKNVIDYVGKTQDKHTGIRDLYKLFLNAEGSIGLVSFHMHLSGGLYKPAVVVAGAREPVSFTRFPGHQYLATDGCLPCATKACWHCNIDSCTNLVDYPYAVQKKVPKCVDIIPHWQVADAIRQYYVGGRLDHNNPSEKPKELVPRVVKMSQINPKTVLGYGEPVKNNSKQLPPEYDISKYGKHFNKFGGGAIRADDWQFLEDLISANKIKTVMEFGSGLSTLLFADAGCEVVSLETNQKWRERILEVKKNLNILMWDGKKAHGVSRGTCDLAFVDGPSGGGNREEAVKIAAEQSDIVIVHDGYDVWEKVWQKKYLYPKFDRIWRNAGRCYLWARKGKSIHIPDYAKKIDPEPFLQGKVTTQKEVSPNSAPSPAVQNKKGLIKIVSTARGWGGCARSVTTIMRLLLKQGWDVEFIPFRNQVSSREFKQILSDELKDVKVTLSYDAISKPCDVLFVYADDFVWEFPNPIVGQHFQEIKAKRKVMMLNYRRGKAGEVDWTRGWDKYMFLNSTQELEFMDAYMKVEPTFPAYSTKVLPPCTDLTPFFKVTPDYNGSIRLVRHSSQGDTKFCKDTFAKQVSDILFVPGVQLMMLPGPSFIDEAFCVGLHADQCPPVKWKRTADPEVIEAFLSWGNLFWYSLPAGYMDMGPRVILEAMAAGLPVLADNWGGAADRVTPETGWLCNEKKDHVEIIKHLTSRELKKKGEAARERARTEFVPERWASEILYDSK